MARATKAPATIRLDGINVKDLVKEIKAEQAQKERDRVKEGIQRWLQDRLDSRRYYEKQSGTNADMIAKIDEELKKLEAGDETLLASLEQKGYFR